MADDKGRGWHGDPEGHAQAGSQSSGNPNAAQNLSDEDRAKGGRASSAKQDMSELGRKGGKAAQESGAAHELTDEERSRGGQVSSSKQDMSELGRKGGRS